MSAKKNATAASNINPDTGKRKYNRQAIPQAVKDANKCGKLLKEAAKYDAFTTPETWAGMPVNKLQGVKAAIVNVETNIIPAQLAAKIKEIEILGGKVTVVDGQITVSAAGVAAALLVN